MITKHLTNDEELYNYLIEKDSKNELLVKRYFEECAKYYKTNYYYPKYLK